MGKVYLVGAGPGAICYLTLDAKRYLGQAEVLVYDSLVDDQLQTLVPEICELIPVGKRGGQPSTPQQQINQILIDRCQRNKQVVRLKSGDPFIFGRAMAEIQALQEAQCEFAIIPGLSSALTAPLLAGIPLTDTVLSRGFGVFTAHEPEALNWSNIATLETLVLLMAGRQFPLILQQLQVHQRSPDTPIAIIRWAGQPQQQVWVGTLLNILQKVGRASLSPCVIVIGEVVGLRRFVVVEND
jgi:uroporphyrinogen III methyltransferase/synthase